ncbi:MAG: hypothetical protein IPK17_37400 [Chloroflexi bacterium]|uniref:asparagine synthase-related protein n=1 Tax=Candidatus Flexifilum breve TaxID=3140694 RepID=UPI0031370332|nr:hypothetical protein [Chloroflexota bacterium]
MNCAKRWANQCGRRLISDVPLGAFLSGGLDGGLIVALMRRHQNGTIRTFSIGFAGDDSFDATQYARRSGRSLGLETHGLHGGQPAGVRPRADAGLASRSAVRGRGAIPVSGQSAHAQRVTVALTGDVGDIELFAGYERFYAHSLLVQRAVRRCPSLMGQGRQRDSRVAKARAITT